MALPKPRVIQVSVFEPVFEMCESCRVEPDDDSFERVGAAAGHEARRPLQLI
jgi:hypothetical protein